ncbi:MAG: hypothetical protein ACLGH3_04105 [Actinomycetota bacterium]
MRTEDQLRNMDRDPLTGAPPGTVIETKEFLRTSEFWTTVVTGVFLVIATLSLESLDAPRTSWLITVLAATYTLSRGIAKAGSAHPFFGRDMSLTDRFHRSTGDGDRRDGYTDGRDGYSDAREEEIHRLELRLQRLEEERGGRQIHI